MAGGPKRTPIQRERDKQTIIELRLKGWTQQQIADYVELDVSTINRQLKKINEEWRQERLDDADLYIKQELRRLSMLEAECWQAWQRSQGSSHSELIERLATGRDESGSPVGRVKTLTRTETKVGDAQFLTIIMKVISERIKLLGLAPTPARQMKVVEAMQVLIDQGIALPEQADVLYRGLLRMEDELKQLPEMVSTVIKHSASSHETVEQQSEHITESEDEARYEQ